MSSRAKQKPLVAKSLADYTKLTMQVCKSWETPKKTIDPWFRGLSSINHTLLPGWYRLGKRTKGIDEDDLQDEFQRRAIPLLEGRKPESLWEWCFLMQHYGLPTRLLDWSESSLVALYFAIGDWKGKGGAATDDAVVWMLDPWFLNKWSMEEDTVFRYDEPEIARYLPERLYDADDSPERPIALMPLHSNRRLTAQRGVFTMHGTDSRPLEQMLQSIKAPHLEKLTIPKKHVLGLRKELQLTGATDVTYFPEIPYLCQDILKNWNLAGAPVEDDD